MKHLILCFLVLCPFAYTFGQYIDKFSEDHELYIKQMDKFLKATKRDDCKELASKFVGTWNGMLNTQKDRVIELSNVMVGRKMRAFPYFYNFYEVVMIYFEKEQIVDSFDPWMQSLQSVLENSKKGNHKNYKAYMKFSKALFSKDGLYDSEAKTWAMVAGSYKLSYDSVPKITIPRLKLYAFTKGDTIMIHNTRGYFSPYDNIWHGEYGTVFWTRAGLDSTRVYCKFGEYSIDISKSLYTIDSVIFNNYDFMDQSLVGSLTDKLVVGNKEETSSYPRFDSRDMNLQIDNLTDHVKFRGGISLHGNRIIGRGSAAQKAVLKFYSMGDTLAVVAKSRRFLIKKDHDVKSRNAEVTIILSEDSIYHPGLELVFKIPNRQLSLLRGESGISKTAFFNSYHQLETHVEEVDWELDKQEMSFDMVVGKGETPAVFESANYFERNRLEKYQHIMDYNPISVIKKYAEDYGIKEMYADDLAKRMGPNYTVETIRRLLYKLVEEGFIYYDQEKELVTVKGKTFHYVFANRDIIDYDIIKINAITPKTTGLLNLHNFSLDLEGVQSVKLSDSQFVVIFPKDRFLQIKKNRDMDFNGTVFAGRMDYSGEGFSFHYDDFKLGLSDVDKFLINIPGEELDPYGKPKLIPLKTTIRGLTGSIAIDAPDNKSGKQKIPQYPVFESLKESYAFYDHKSILGGVYPKERFYFELDPFIIDSLNTFAPSGLFFNGNFISANIFQDFREQLRIQEDLSLGFRHKTSTDGRSLYQNKGHFTDSIFLSNKGLRGKGTINYLTSTMTSRDIIFYPDSLNCYTDTVYIDKRPYNGVEFPNVYNDRVYVHWVPYDDSMQLKRVDHPFRMFESQADLIGDLTLTPKGLKGIGIMDFEGAQLITTHEFRYKSNSFEVDTAELKFKAVDPDQIAFRAPNVSAEVNFKKRIGKFKSNLKEMSIEFPYNQYKTSINEFVWDMDKKTIDFKSEDGKALFVSTHPDQDSLQFNGANAVFSLETNVLDIHGIPFIYVADAKVIPDSNYVIIDPGARMRKLHKAVVEVDTITHYHTLYDAEINIYGRKSYMGEGVYDYVNLSKEPQPINFHDISVFEDEIDEEILTTQADGRIKEAEEFFLNPRIAYKGNVHLVATKKYLTFDGFAKLEHHHPKVTTQWFSFKNEINPDSMYINVENPVNENGRNLFAGFILASEPLDVYTTFMDAKRNPNDDLIFNANGIFIYNEVDNEFVIGTEPKVLGRTTIGNILKFNDESGIFYGEGLIDLNTNADLIDITSVGSITNNLNDNKFIFDMVMGMDFKLSNELLQILQNVFLELTYDMPDIDYTVPNFERSVLTFIEDEKEQVKFSEEYQKTGIFKKPDEIKSTLFLTDVKLQWNAGTETFVSIAPMGLSYIGDKPINKMIVSYMEFGKKRSGGFFTIYLQAAAEEWYYLSYKNKILSILTSNAEFTKILTTLALEKRRSKGPNNKLYVYQKGGSTIQKDNFVTRLKGYQKN